MLPCSCFEEVLLTRETKVAQVSLCFIRAAGCVGLGQEQFARKRGHCKILTFNPLPIILHIFWRYALSENLEYLWQIYGKTPRSHGCSAFYPLKLPPFRFRLSTSHLFTCRDAMPFAMRDIHGPVRLWGRPFEIAGISGCRNPPQNGSIRMYTFRAIAKFGDYTTCLILFQSFELAMLLKQSI